MRFRRVRNSNCWRALVESPLLLSVWLAIVLACIAVHDVAQALRRAETVRGAATTALARVAAETAAVLHLPPSSERDTVSIAGIDVTMQKTGDVWRLTSTAGGDQFSFRAAELAGAAPTVFAHGWSAVDPQLVPRAPKLRRIAAQDLPVLDDAVVSRAPRADRSTALHRDRGIALLTWENGTERDDFVFDAKASTQLGAAGDLLVVPGHLWIEAGAQPLGITLQNDLVIVVLGNVYAGRSIVVDGGRLVIVAVHAADTPVFADADGDGRWSSGDVLRVGGEVAGPPEGTGNVWLGLPASTGTVALDAAIVAFGEVHLRATTHVAGPAVLAYGVTTPRRASFRFVPEAQWAFAIERERVAGFRTSGAPRLGLLAPYPARSNEPAQQALYLSSPAR